MMSDLQVVSEISLDAKFQEAELYVNQGLNEEACQIYKEILAYLNGKDHPLKAKIEENLKRIEGVDRQIGLGAQTAEESEEESNEKRFNNCLGLMEAGFHSEAIDEFKVLLDKGFRVGEVNAKIGECYLRLDMPFEAVEAFEEALKDPNVSQEVRLNIFYQLAIAHEKTGAVPRAIEALEQIIKIDRGFRNAAQRLDDLTKTAQKYGRFYNLIIEGHITEEELEQAREIAKQSRKSIESILLSKVGVEKMALGRSLSEYYRCPFVEFNELEVGSTPSCIHGIKEHFFRTNTCVPVKEEGDVLHVAVDNPHDLIKIDNIRRVLKAGEFHFVVSLKEDIDKFIDYFFGKYSLGESDVDVFEQLELVEEEEEVDEEEDLTSDVDSVVVQLANKIIEDAYVRQASDIHIESLTGKRGALVRFRIDGDCMRYQTIPYNYKRALISRIKIMANLDIAEKRLPQDGKIKFKTRRGRTIELRVATLPTTEGNEDIVLRILAATDAMPLDKIGLSERNLERLKKLIEMPYGLIFVVGPTGSGKTTTLHAALGYINRPEKKIWTAEDPVEIVQDGLRQVQVKPSIGLTFARVLRAFLRADPDIIMVGETRDEETAHTVIEASLTGHLVFSTLHTNSAPETVTRLLGMGIDPFNFADALLGVLAQRLVKRLCPKCKVAYSPDEEEKKLLLYEYGAHPSIPLDLDAYNNLTLYKPNGCEFCNRTGYKGRLAIHELLVCDDAMRDLIQKRSPVSEIQKHAMGAGMLTLKQDGIHKILQGDTDLKQVRAACVR